MLSVIGRPGHSKTTLGGYLVKREAERLAANGIENRYAAHISWEQPVEELEAMYHSGKYGVSDVAWGRVPIGEVIANTAKRPGLPVWLFGESIYSTTFDTPPMTIERVYDGIRGIYKEWGKLPSLLFFDYIQDIPVPSERDRYSQVSAAMRMVKRLAVQAKTPVILGVQANARVDDYKSPIPTLRDAEWSAVIGQKSDAVISLWRPIRTFLPQDEPFIEVGGKDYDNTEQLLVIKLLKQRFEKGYGIWAVRFDPDELTLNDYTVIEIA